MPHITEPIKRPDLSEIKVIVPNFKRRLSGVTATIARLVPIQAKRIPLATLGPGLPDGFPGLSFSELVLMPRRHVDGGPRVWHARRNTEMIGGLAAKYLLRKHLKLVFTSASQRRQTWLTRWLIRRMDAVIATSERTAAFLQRPSTVILHGIDVERFVPVTETERDALRRDLGLPEAGRLVACYGRIRAQKGTDVFVDAMLKVLPERPGVTALVMGRATEKHRAFERDLRARVEVAGLSKRILFLPEVAVDDMVAWYQVLDLFVAPQRWEGFGLTPLEAMSCGVPVVATTVGAFPEIVSDGETGDLVPPGDVGAMVEAVEGMMDDKNRLARVSELARTRMLEQFRIEAEADAINVLYRRLLRDA